MSSLLRKYYYFTFSSLNACLLSIAGYVYDWTLSTKVAIDELQVGGFGIKCSEM